MPCLVYYYNNIIVDKEELEISYWNSRIQILELERTKLKTQLHHLLAVNAHTIFSSSLGLKIFLPPKCLISELNMENYMTDLVESGTSSLPCPPTSITHLMSHVVSGELLISIWYYSSGSFIFYYHNT